jgi:cell division protein FtsW
MNMAMRRSQRHNGLQNPRDVAVTFCTDRYCLLAVIGLVLVGLLMVASTSIVIAEKQYHQAFYFLIRQVSYLCIGCTLGLIVLRVETEQWRKYSGVLLVFTVLLLVAVLIPGMGRVVNGSRRWLELGVLRMQVSEIAKLVFVVFLSAYVVRRQTEVRTQFSGFLKPLFIYALLALLVLREPDFGAIVVMGICTLLILYLAEVRGTHFLLLLGVISSVFTFIAVTSPYRLMRLTSFIDPWSRQFDSGYQLTQSLIAFGRGGWFGVGLGLSVQKLFYLPEAHNDFLFAILAEEFGLLGVLVVLGLYALLVFRGLLIARRAQGAGLAFAGFVAYGITFLFGSQALINIGVNSGVLPTKGLTLPFMSYGGSSMLINCIAVALLLRIDYETRRLIFRFES